MEYLEKTLSQHFDKAKSPQQFVDEAMQDVALLSQTVANEVTE